MTDLQTIENDIAKEAQETKAVRKAFSQEIKVFDLPKLDAATADDAAQVEAEFHGFHQMARLSRYAAASRLFWLYRWHCFDSTGATVRGSWKKLYDRLGLPKTTAYEYRETARKLAQHPEVMALPAAKLDELARVDSKEIDQIILEDEHGEVMIGGQSLDELQNLTPEQLRERLKEARQQLDESRQAIEEGEKQLEDKDKRIADLEENNKEWRIKYKHLREIGTDLNVVVSQARSSMRALTKRIAELREEIDKGDNLNTIRELHHELAQELDALARAAGIAVDFDAIPTDAHVMADDEFAELTGEDPDAAREWLENQKETANSGN